MAYSFIGQWKSFTPRAVGAKENIGLVQSWRKRFSKYAASTIYLCIGDQQNVILSDETVNTAPVVSPGSSESTNGNSF